MSHSLVYEKYQGDFGKAHLDRVNSQPVKRNPDQEIDSLTEQVSELRQMVVDLGAQLHELKALIVVAEGGKKKA
jgi:hypothetical protein